jgi:hypothetical protein
MEQTSLDNSADEAPAESCMPQAKPLAYQSRESVSEMSDDTLRQYEAGCFARLKESTSISARDEWLHAMASAMVEMFNRGLSLGGKQ